MPLALRTMLTLSLKSLQQRIYLLLQQVPAQSHGEFILLPDDTGAYGDKIGFYKLCIDGTSKRNTQAEQIYI